ncbi:MAG: Gfo/Idh/MocA family oxidoreductase [candidate division WS1 bacterium]|jgi:predicted dehydrogenase|nr:Gfo/Idh/MocA family oxidoreductase [candidate division WS1 bacterium]
MDTPIRIGVIGIGGRGRIARQWKREDGLSTVVGGADITDKYFEEFREFNGDDVFLTHDYRELLARDDIDAIAVTSPDFMHEEHAVAALEAGKHVFCEKPLAITIEGCDHILETWRASGKKFMVGFNMRYMRMFNVMKSIAEDGVIGDIKAVWVRHFVGQGGNFYYHDWHATQQNATSLLLQKGSHDIDMIHWITGAYTKRVVAMGSLDFFGGDKPNDLDCRDCDEIETCPDPFTAPTRTQCAFREEVNVEDHEMLLMDLEGGIKAAYLQCQYTPDYHRNYCFIGTKGRMECQDITGDVKVLTRKGNSPEHFADRSYHVKTAEGTHGGADPVIADDFIQMLLRDKPPVATPLAGRMSVAVGVKGAESLRNGCIPLEIPAPPSWAR